MIIRQLKDLSLTYKTFVTHVVIFTHCPFKEKSIEWNDWELIDSDDIKLKKENIGKVIPVKIISSNKNTLFGEMINNYDKKVA